MNHVSTDEVSTWIAQVWSEASDYRCDLIYVGHPYGEHLLEHVKQICHWLHYGPQGAQLAREELTRLAAWAIGCMRVVDASVHLRPVDGEVLDLMLLQMQRPPVNRSERALRGVDRISRLLLFSDGLTDLSDTIELSCNLSALVDYMCAWVGLEVLDTQARWARV